MDEIIIPKTEDTGTGNIGKNLPEGFVRYSLPDSFTDSEKIKIALEVITPITTKIIELDKKSSKQEKKLIKYKEDSIKQGSKNIEVIGLFSAVLALLIIDVSIIKSVDAFLNAILLISGLTCSVSIFAILIHIFFSPDDKIKFKRYFWIPFIILSLLVLVGIIAYIYKPLNNLIYYNNQTLEEEFENIPNLND